ncbi:hypothetical protein MTO96_010087 [Rhipicephalus appendiculatus]
MELKRWPLVSSSFSLFAFSFLHAQLAAHDHFLYVPLAIRILHHDKTAVVTKLLSSSFAAGPLPSTSPLSSLPPASFPSFSSASPSSFVFFQVTFHICSCLATDAFILCGPMFFVLTVAVSFPFKVFSAQSQPSAFLSTSSSDLLFFIPGLPSFFVTMLQLPDPFFRDSLASSLLSWGVFGLFLNNLFNRFCAFPATHVLLALVVIPWCCVIAHVLHVCSTVCILDVLLHCLGRYGIPLGSAAVVLVVAPSAMAR